MSMNVSTYAPWEWCAPTDAAYSTTATAAMPRLIFRRISILLMRSLLGRINPALRLRLARAADTRRCGIVVRVIGLIAQAHPVLVEPPDRILEQCRRGIAGGHGP